MDLSVKNNIKRIPVIKNNKLIGIITQTDLSREFDKFVSKNMFESSNIPLARCAMTDYNVILALKDESLLSVIKCIVRENADCAVIKKDKMLGISGILTEKEIIDEFYKNPHSISKLKVGTIMNRGTATITPGADLFEVNRMMIQNKLRRIPVMSNKKIVAIVTIKNVLKNINSFLSEMVPKEVKREGNEEEGPCKQE